MTDSLAPDDAAQDEIFGWAEKYGYLPEYYKAKALQSVVEHLDSLLSEAHATLDGLSQEPRTNPIKQRARAKRNQLSDLLEEAEAKAYEALGELQSKPEILHERRNEFNVWRLHPPEVAPLLTTDGDEFYGLVFGSSFDEASELLVLRSAADGQITILNRPWVELGVECEALREEIEAEVKADRAFYESPDYITFNGERPVSQTDETRPAVQTSREAVVQLEALGKSYGEFVALNSVSFEIGRGEIFGLLGPNGAGKTTAIETIVGLKKPTSGSVRVFGVEPAVEREVITKRVAVQPQSANLFATLTVRETLELFASFHAKPRRVDEVLAEVELQDFAKHKAKSLSGGQYRRLLLSVALVADPELLVLDEPSAGLDPAARQSLWEIIYKLRERGITVILSTHHMDEATAVCDRVAILVNGEVAALDSPDALTQNLSGASDVAFTVPVDVDREMLESVLSAEAFTVEERGDRLRVKTRTQEPDDLVRRITFAHRLHAREFTVQQRSLEDVFLELARSKEES